MTALLQIGALWLLAALPIGAQTLAGRLPEGVVPSRYAIRIVPDIERATFTGSVDIEIDVQRSMPEIVLHSLGLRIDSAKLDDTLVHAKLDENAQTLTLTGARAEQGKHRLNIDFSGKLAERPQGLYLTRYQLPDGTWQKALATQMEPADARRMFPCWDEPGIRSAFQLTAVVPAKHTALFNMPVEKETTRELGKKEVVFATTPPMASYLVAFVSAELESIEDEVAGVKLRVLATPGKRAQMRYAMEATKKVLPWFNEYFGVKYPLPKLDQVSFPSTGAGGMENWGCIIYADTALLLDEQQGSQSNAERVFDVVAHEIAHQWFGDLVTMKWWDDLWLNEGFASWMATKVSAHFNPTWKKWERSTNSKETAMRLDARATTHPIQQPVVTAGQAMQAFDEITYQKGRAFLRMLESWLGEEKFRAGLRRYFAKHAHGNTVTADLWQALSEETGEPVGEMARGWTEQPAFPLVTVRVTGEGAEQKVTLTQERFAIHQKTPAPLRWRVPVVLRGIDGQSAPQRVLLGDEPAIVNSPLPVVANAGGAGYFRVSYEGEAWKSLRSRIAELPEADRLSLLQDGWALAQAGRVPITRWLDLATALRRDTSPLIGTQIISGIAMLDHLATGAPERSALRTWAREFLAPQWQRLGWKAAEGEDLATSLHRSDLIELLGTLGENEIMAEAKKRADQFLEQPSTLPGDLRAAVLHLAGREATSAWWGKVHGLARKTSDTEQKALLYGALVAAQEPALVARALQVSLSGELPSKLAVRIVGRVAAEGDQPDLAWNFARGHLEELLALCSAGEANEFMGRLARNFSNPSRADELEALTKASLPKDALKAAAIAADEVRFKAEFKARILPIFATWFQEVWLKR